MYDSIIATCLKYFCLLLIGFPLIASTDSRLIASTDIPQLTIYTYRSFVSKNGPGQAIKSAFELKRHGTINWVALDDGVSILNRLKLEGLKTKADIILGLDHHLMLDAKKTGLLARHRVNCRQLNLVTPWTDDYFIPYDYGYFAFMYNQQKLQNPPKSLFQLINTPSIKVIYPDPRTSSVGQGFIFWMKSIYGDHVSSAWQNLAKHTVTVPKGWSEAYYLFLQGEADVLLSYTLSPAYQYLEKGSSPFKVAYFSEGHYQQVEVAAKINRQKINPLADDFLAFLISQEAQAILAKGNVMYPVIDLPENNLWLKNFPVPDSVPSLKLETVSENRAQWIREWQQALIGTY